MSGPGSRDLPRVVVTGTGMVTALGCDVASTWAGLLAGRAGIRTITSFDASALNSHIPYRWLPRIFGVKMVVLHPCR